MFFSPFSIGQKRASLCAFLAFVCFALVGLCLFPLPLGARDWLLLVIVALPGLFFLSFLFLTMFQVNWPFGSGDEVQNRYSRERPWRPTCISNLNDLS